MTSDDGWQTVGEKAPKQRQSSQQSGNRNQQQQRRGNANQQQGGNRNVQQQQGGRQQQQQPRGNAPRQPQQQQQQQQRPQSYAALAGAGARNVIARQPKKEQSVDVSSAQSDSVTSPNQQHRTRSDSQPQQPYFFAKKESKPRKSLQEYEWNDLKQLRRIVAHLESIANYSKGGIIGSLRGKTIHNSEDREQDLTPISEIKINAQEDAFMRYIADFVDVKQKRDPDMDTLLGFMTILLTCIAHTRYYNQEQEVDNYWTYHEKFSYNVWKKSVIPTTLHESILRELQEKLQSKPLAIDKDQLQLLLTGKEFQFRFPGNLSVPYCLNAIKEYANSNQSKTVSQRRRLYRYEHRSGLGSRSAGNVSTDRKEWNNVAHVSKDYRTQVETFEKMYMNAEGAPVLGISSIDTLLHSIYTTFLKIRKRETPQDLLNRLKQLLLALPNLIDLPELLQQLNPSQNWCGYKNIEAYPDLSDYKELKQNLEALLEREGVKKVTTQADPIRDTLEAIYEFNNSEEQKTAAYKKALNAGTADKDTEKGYPLSPKFLKALLRQMQLTEEDLNKYDDSIKKVSKLNGLNGIANTVRKSVASGGKQEDSDDEQPQTDDFRSRFDEMATMEMS